MRLVVEFSKTRAKPKINIYPGPEISFITFKKQASLQNCRYVGRAGGRRRNPGVGWSK